AQEGIVQQKHFYRSKLSIIDGYRKLQSSDLAIRVSRALEGNLRPLDHETQRKALQVVEQENEEFKLAFKLMMFSGLRLNESLSFPSFLLLDECFPIDGSKLIRGVNIGPMYGVKTKFSKERELFITVRLAEEIVNYQLSDRYQKKF
ncbi:hypothetical protein CGJ97_24285, partial [Vibrio parahaemolyticus]|uniref:hypothetical protein n=1 Tax=Vibrio parahaemolyticus TaxID=670 RepID=UPI001166F515